MTTHVAADQLLEELRAEYAGQWRIWRSQRDGVPVSWCASIRDPAAGIDPTVICTTAESLRAALADQAKKAEAGPRAKLVITR
jgi:hypothetical protein